MSVITDELATEHIAANINRLLVKREKSRYWLARVTGEYESTIANVCNGKTVCSAARLARIAAALDTTIDILMSDPKNF